MGTSLWKRWLGVGIGVVLLYVVLPDHVALDYVYMACGLSIPVAIIIGVRRFAPVPAAPWLWIALGMALMWTADVVWFVLDWMGLEPFPSVADVLFLSMYPCLAVGLALMVRHRNATRELSSLLDAAIVSIGAAVVTWVLVGSPMLADVEMTALAGWVSIAYPMLDLLVMAVLARLVFGGGARNGALLLLALGLSANFVADILYVFEGLTGTYSSYGLMDGTWLTAYILIGASALHPSMTEMSKPAGALPEQVTPLRLLALTVASVTAPGILLVQWMRGAALEVPIVATAAIAMFVLVVARVSELGRLVAVTRARGEARFRSLVHNATDVIIVVDANGTITYTSPALDRMWHHRSSDVLGTPFARLLHPDDVDRFTRSFSAALASDTIDGATFDGRIWSSAHDWRSFEALTANLLDDPSVNGVVLTCRDITERVALEAQLTHQAFHDPLTDLANRALFLDRVEHALDRLARRGRLVAVLFIDLDDFKTVNDGLGHSAGDTLLREVAYRLTSSLRPDDTAARLGGDEFAVLVEDAADRDTITAVAERLITAIQQPFAVDDTMLHIKSSIGIAIRDSAGPAHLLIRDADLAMYEAKTNGKDGVAWFDPAMRAQAVDRLQLRNDLATALAHDELFLVYQPIVDLANGHIVGAEALVRWRHPTRGVIAPSEFVPIAEQSGMITEIGDWVLRTATMEATRWHRATAERPNISVNVSAVQLRDPAIVTRVRDALDQSGLPAGYLTLELTESTLMDDVERTRAVLHDLKDLGATIAIDDFGTGYSSLAYLRQFPVDVLKIDRSFVSELSAHIASRSLAQDIISLARALDLTSVAEGIETPEQLARLRAMDCGFGQGYYFARPLDTYTLMRQLRQQSQMEIPA